MNSVQRTSLKAANRIRDRMIAGRSEQPAFQLPTAEWDNSLRLTRLIELAESRNWSSSAHQLKRDLVHSIFRIIDGLRTVSRRLDEQQENSDPPKLKDIYQEILALYDEFEQVDCDLSRNILSVTTDDVLLGGVPLGPFEIELDWNRLGESQPYDVIAVDPHPAASNSDTTHPHVQSRSLCEGDGRAPIRQALQQGRLSDFFLIVQRILHTYYPGSAYISLEDWNGILCTDCSVLILEEETYSCRRCESLLCCECGVSCTGCDEIHCSTCLEMCHDCELSFCQCCLTACPDCEHNFCDGCLIKERCHTCHENKQELDQQCQTESDRSGETENAEDTEASPAQAIPQDSETTATV